MIVVFYLETVAKEVVIQCLMVVICGNCELLYNETTRQNDVRCSG